MIRYTILIASFQITNEKIFKRDITRPMKKYTTEFKYTTNYKDFTESMRRITGSHNQSRGVTLANSKNTATILADTTNDIRNSDITRSMTTYSIDYLKSHNITRNINMDATSIVKRKDVNRSINRHTTYFAKHKYVIPSVKRNTTTIHAYITNYINNRNITPSMNQIFELTKRLSQGLNINTKKIIHNSTDHVKTREKSGFKNRNSIIILDTTKSKFVRGRRVDYKKLEAEAKEAMPNEENYFEPYWHSGEWVYMRVTVPRGSKGKPGSVKLPIGQYRACDYICSNLFLYAGKICGMRFEDQTGKKLEYKEFPSACDMEYENCKDQDKRPMYIFLQKGPCTELTTLKVYPSDADELISNVKKWAPFVTLPRNWTLKEHAYLYY